MKNILKYYLFFFVLFCFIGLEPVLAAEPMVCVYEGGLQGPATMLIQDSEGNLKVKINHSNETDIEYSEWWDPTTDNHEVKYDFDGTKYYEDNKKLTDCPAYTRNKSKWETDKYVYTFYFYDEKTWNHLDYPLYEKHGVEIDENDYSQSFEGNYSEDINNNKWIGTCNYKDEDGSITTTLYFNRNKMIIAEDSDLIHRIYTNFSLNELLSVYDEIKDCPVLHAKNTCYANIGNTFCTIEYSLEEDFHHNDNDNPTEDSEIKPENDPNDNTVDFDVNIEEIDKCSSLLGDPEQSSPATPAYYLTIVFSVIRYAAIIILIIFTILDFVTAVAAHDDDAIKKAVNKTMKRAFLCVILLLLPTLIEFVLQFIHNIQIHDCIKYKS